VADDDMIAQALERLRQRYRAQLPHERLIALVDRRHNSPISFVLVAVDRSSAWYDLLPAEQLVELQDAPDERPTT
jgi:hypothetical protein